MRRIEYLFAFGCVLLTALLGVIGCIGEGDEESVDGTASELSEGFQAEEGEDVAPGPSTDAACILVDSESPPHMSGRVINLWLCNDFYHGQIASARAGDRVWLEATPHQRFSVASGVTFANTQDVFMISNVCGHVFDTGGVWCTRR